MIRKNRNPSTLLVETQNGSAAMATVWTFLEKLNMDLPYDHNSISRYIPPKIKNRYSKQSVCAHMCVYIHTCS